jgi:hypothetical protein
MALHHIQEFISCYVRNINSFIRDKFQSNYCIEIWEDIFEVLTHVKFNNFLNICLKLLYVCFTKSKTNSTHRYKRWITGGINVSCDNKRILYMSCRGNKVTNLKLRNKRNFKMLKNVIKTAKKCIMMN